MARPWSIRVSARKAIEPMPGLSLDTIWPAPFARKGSIVVERRRSTSHSD